MTGSVKILHVGAQVFTYFYNFKCHNFHIIWGSIVEILVSVQKSPSVILVEKNQKSVALLGLYSWFCEDV